MQETSGTVQTAAASLLGRLQVQALHGPRVTLTLQRLLPPGLIAAIQASSAPPTQGPVDVWLTAQLPCLSSHAMLKICILLFVGFRAPLPASPPRCAVNMFVMPHKHPLFNSA